MTVNAFAKDILGKPSNLNCFSFYLFHGTWEQEAEIENCQAFSTSHSLSMQFSFTF